MKVSSKIALSLIFSLWVSWLTGCAGDGSISSHFTLTDRINSKKSIEVVFIDFQPTRVFVVDGCDSSLSSCIVGGIVESSVLSVTGLKDTVAEQKLRFASRIRNTFERSAFKDQFLTTLATETGKCGLKLNYRQSILVENQQIGSLSGATSLKWDLGGQESTEHARKSIFPKLSHIGGQDSMVLLIAVAQVTLFLGNDNTIFPSLGYMFYDKQIDTITRLGSRAFARKGKEIRVVRDISSEPEVAEELKKSAGWSAKRLAYDMCGGIGSDNPNIRSLGKELL